MAKTKRSKEIEGCGCSCGCDAEGRDYLDDGGGIYLCPDCEAGECLDDCDDDDDEEDAP